MSRFAASSSSRVALKDSQQFFWRVADKADCIGQDKLALFGKAQPARCRVQGGKKPVADNGFGIGQTIEKSRFSRIRVAHKGGHRHTVARPAPAGKGALAPYIVQFPAQVGHAFAVLAPVHFESLVSPRPRPPMPPASLSMLLFLPARRAAGRRQAWPVQPGACRRAMWRASQNIQNKLGAVQHLAFGNIREIVELGWRKLPSKTRMSAPAERACTSSSASLPLPRMKRGFGEGTR